MKKSIDIKTKIEKLSDEEDKLEKCDFYANIIYDFLGTISADMLKIMT